MGTFRSLLRNLTKYGHFNNHVRSNMGVDGVWTRTRSRAHMCTKSCSGHLCLCVLCVLTVNVFSHCVCVCEVGGVLSRWQDRVFPGWYPAAVRGHEGLASHHLPCGTSSAQPHVWQGETHCYQHTYVCTCMSVCVTKQTCPTTVGICTVYIIHIYTYCILYRERCFFTYVYFNVTVSMAVCVFQIFSQANTPVKRWLLNFAARRKGAEVSAGVIRSDSLWDKIFFSKIQVDRLLFFSFLLHIYPCLPSIASLFVLLHNSPSQLPSLVFLFLLTPPPPIVCLWVIVTDISPTVVSCLLLKIFPNSKCVGYFSWPPVSPNPVCFQASLGGRLRMIITGAAPASPTVLGFLRAALGCQVSKIHIEYVHTYRCIHMHSIDHEKVLHTYSVWHLVYLVYLCVYLCVCVYV